MSPAERPSAAERVRRGSPVSQPQNGRSVSPAAPRVNPVRFTIDFDPTMSDQLDTWAFSARDSAGGRAKKSNIVRALVEILLGDPDVEARVRARLQQP